MEALAKHKPYVPPVPVGNKRWKYQVGATVLSRSGQVLRITKQCINTASGNAPWYEATLLPDQIEWFVYEDVIVAHLPMSVIQTIAYPWRKQTHRIWTEGYCFGYKNGNKDGRHVNQHLRQANATLHQMGIDSSRRALVQRDKSRNAGEKLAVHIYNYLKGTKGKLELLDNLVEYCVSEGWNGPACSWLKFLSDYAHQEPNRDGRDGDINME